MNAGSVLVGRRWSSPSLEAVGLISLEFLFKGHSFHPSRNWTTRRPYEAFRSGCVTCTIIVPASFSVLNRSMISVSWLVWRLVGSSARMTVGLARR